MVSFTDDCRKLLPLIEYRLIFPKSNHPGGVDSRNLGPLALTIRQPLQVEPVPSYRQFQVPISLDGTGQVKRRINI